MSREFLYLIFLLLESSVCMRTSDNGLYTDIVVKVDKNVIKGQECKELKGNIQVNTSL